MKSNLSTEEVFTLLVKRFYEDTEAKQTGAISGPTYDAVIDSLEDFIENYSNGGLGLKFKAKVKTIQFPTSEA